MNCCNEYGQCKGGKGCPVGESLPSRYGDRLDPLKGHKGYVTPDGTFAKEV